MIRFLGWLTVVFMISLGYPINGFADIPDSVMILPKEGFAVAYAPSLLCPLAVAWDIQKNDLTGVKKRPSMSFRTDYYVPAPRAKSRDYVRSGYDRGHLCPAADRKSSLRRYRATFIMKNVAPMCPDLNRGPWKRAEQMARDIAERGYQIKIRCGVIQARGAERVLHNSQVFIPDGFWRLVYTLQPDTMVSCWVFANDSTCLRAGSGIVPLDSLRHVADSAFLPPFLRDGGRQYSPLIKFDPWKK